MKRITFAVKKEAESETQFGPVFGFFAYFWFFSLDPPG